MPQKQSLTFVKNIQQLAENYSENFNKQIPDAQNYSVDFIAEKTDENNLKLKKKIISDAESVLNRVNLYDKELHEKQKEILFPLLSKTYNDNANIRGEQQITNANLVFQMNFLNGNSKFVIEQLKQALNDSERRDFFSTLLNQTINFHAKEDPQFEAITEANKIKAEFELKTGIDKINEALSINSYAKKMSEVVINLVDKDYGGFSIPDFGSREFQDRMDLENLGMHSGVDISEFRNESTTLALT